MLFIKTEDDHVVRAPIAHGIEERDHVGDVVGVARRLVAGEAGFDVTYLRRCSERKLGKTRDVGARLTFEREAIQSSQTDFSLIRAELPFSLR